MRALILIFSLVASSHLYAQNFLLSGEVKTKDSQVFYAPRTDNWRVQLKWMLPEGDIAKPGDVVVVFDSGTIENAIEQAKAQLLTAKDELFRVESESAQKLIEAEHEVAKTTLLLEKAKIDAGIGNAFISTFDYEKNQLAFEKAIVAKVKAEEKLSQVIVANEVAIKKQKLSIAKTENELRYQTNKLTKMRIEATKEGAIIYGKHPWNGEKVFVGMTAQPSWKIAEIPSGNELFIEAWLHEVDFQKVIANQLATLRFDAYPDQKLTTTLLDVATQPEERTQWGDDVYYRLMFSLSTDLNFKIMPGMSVQIEIQEQANAS
ncbi:HlyD family secretion protein [Thalassotalea eurytherma]|uniref:HlyD family efflux transporter periplasmic adaptor subunit n=1 Tax=Thalassotalea eurytherma TaxID=1144278 RepID=A0ABQ6H0E7_9GAMM|nr:HlyD family efflux transporter periplasmic adaptor subunit [Thalassotalea eurytherma]GLX81668.1 hypothetical protein theurythT_11200 [Thalassotalea eurytherma]